MQQRQTRVSSLLCKFAPYRIHAFTKFHDYIILYFSCLLPKANPKALLYVIRRLSVGPVFSPRSERCINLHDFEHYKPISEGKRKSRGQTCRITRRPDGWKGILAGIARYLAGSLSFLPPVSALMAAGWHWTSARCSNPGAMCCTGNEEQHALWCHRLMNRDSGGPTHPPAPSPVPSAHFPDEKKGISLRSTDSSFTFIIELDGELRNVSSLQSALWEPAAETSFGVRWKLEIWVPFLSQFVSHYFSCTLQHGSAVKSYECKMITHFQTQAWSVPSSLILFIMYRQR